MATKKIATNLDLLTNQLTNFAIENVDKLSTPDLSQKGRIVFCTDDHSLHLNNGSAWVKLAEGTDASSAVNALLGTSSDDANANTIHGVRNYATSVARLMGGFNFSKQVTSGTTLSLYANTTASATSNSNSYMIDRASISVRNKAGERIEVDVITPTASNTPAVVLSWSGITPTASDPLTVNYRVILNQTGA